MTEISADNLAFFLIFPTKPEINGPTPAANEVETVNAVSVLLTLKLACFPNAVRVLMEGCGRPNSIFRLTSSISDT